MGSDESEDDSDLSVDMDVLKTLMSGKKISKNKPTSGASAASEALKEVELVSAQEEKVPREALIERNVTKSDESEDDSDLSLDMDVLKTLMSGKKISKNKLPSEPSEASKEVEMVSAQEEKI